jgi:hypothetical protein
MASSIGSAAAEISSGNQDLNWRPTEQAAALEETSASLASITDSGGDVVDGAVKAMAALTQSSTQIFEIISVIDGIAFQTNLLALNAAVEAARAEGRGFALKVLTMSAARVKDGTRLVNLSGETLKAIVSSCSIDGVRAGAACSAATLAFMAAVRESRVVDVAALRAHYPCGATVVSRRQTRARGARTRTRPRRAARWSSSTRPPRCQEARWLSLYLHVAKISHVNTVQPYELPVGGTKPTYAIIPRRFLAGRTPTLPRQQSQSKYQIHLQSPR